MLIHVLRERNFTAQKMKFSIKDFFSKCDHIHKKVRIWSHLLKKSLLENFIFCEVFEDLLTMIYLQKSVEMENCLELEFKMPGLIYSTRKDQVKLRAQLVGT